MFHTFIQALTFNMANIFIYKIILQTHLAFLFVCISHHLFGIIGTTFSMIYFLISITNFGFDYYIISHHQSFSQSQKAFKSFVHLLAYRIVATIAIALICFIALPYLTHIHQIKYLTDNLPTTLLPILLSVFVFESIKKSLDSIAQMSFLQRSITFIDIATIVAYTSSIWIGYAIQGTITLYTVFVPMAIISMLECLVVSLTLYRYYYSLPAQAESESILVETKGNVIKQFAVNTINQITKAVFSPNFFIIMLSYHISFTKVGYIKLATETIILLYMILNRCFGMPSAALLSSIAKNKMFNAQILTQTFTTILNWYLQFLYSLSSIIIVIMAYCLWHQTCITSTITSNILFFVFAGCVEYFLITYEKWYLIKGKASWLASINIITLLLCYIASRYLSLISPAYILIPYVLIRLANVACIVFLTNKYWNILPTFKVWRGTLLLTLISIASIITIIKIS